MQFLCLPVLIILLADASKVFAARLENYNVDPTQISTSGLSAGAFMAVQMHISHSKIFSGVGVLAGGPFWCAKNNLMTATGACMTSPSLIDVGYLQQITRNTVFTGYADELSFLEDDKVYLYSGTEDSVVKPGVVDKAAEYYSAFVQSGNIMTVFDVPSEHGFPTVEYGGQCDKLNSVYINKCDYDAAYDMLEFIHGGLQQAEYPTGALAGAILTFDQTEFFGGSVFSNIGLADDGYIFVPDACAAETTVCKLHVAFHGCKQGEEYLGQTYVEETGYNEVAALNNIIVIYPQVKKDLISNPNGCFDWWGYTGSAYASNIGEQVVAVRKMVERVASV